MDILGKLVRVAYVVDSSGREYSIEITNGILESELRKIHRLFSKAIADDRDYDKFLYIKMIKSYFGLDLLHAKAFIEDAARHYYGD